MTKSGVSSGTRCVVERRVAFSQRDNRIGVIERQEFSETPDATPIAAIKRAQSRAPQLAQRCRIKRDRARALDIEQSATPRAHVEAFIDLIFGATVSRDATLEKVIAQAERL